VGVTQLSCGMYHTLALTTAGEVLSCGYGGSFLSGAGALGLGDRKQRDSPEKLAAFGGADSDTGARAVSVSAGGYHSTVLDENGVCWSWGRGEWGRLGHSDSSDCLEPTRVEACDEGGCPPNAYCAAGDSHTVSLGADGVVYTWGRNENWQLGYEVSGLLNAGQSLDAQQDPHGVEIGGRGDDEVVTSPAVRAGCGEQGTAAILENGDVYIWGMARYFEPTKAFNVSELDGEVLDWSLGAYHLAVLTTTGKLYTFGTGTALGLPRAARAQWQLCEVTAHSLEGTRVLGVSCGPTSTAIIC